MILGRNIMHKNEEYLNKDSVYCSQGDISSKHTPKKIFSASQGNFLIDANGTHFLDMQMFNSSANFGYCRAEYEQCIKEQLHTLPCLAAEFMNTNRIELSEQICKYMLNTYGIPGRVHFSVGGAQAVDDALKLAINYTKRNGVLTFEGGYHGRTMAASSVSSSYRYTRRFGSVIDTYKLPFPNCSSCAYNMSKNCDLYCVKQIERLFKSEYLGVYDINAQQSKYATFLFEPVLGRGGYVFPPDNYFKEVISLLKKYNIITIADEVQMGFYRTGKMWSFEHYNIIPDIIVFGKSITNGLWPLSGIWAREDIMSPEIWPTGSTHCTFAGHPIGTALGLTTFNQLSNQKNLQAINDSAQYFKRVLYSICEKYDFIHRIQVKGHAAGIDFVQPNTNIPAPDKLKQLIHLSLEEPQLIEGKKYGMILTAGGFYESSLMLSPCVYISQQEIDLFAKLFDSYLPKVL